MRGNGVAELHGIISHWPSRLKMVVRIDSCDPEYMYHDFKMVILRGEGFYAIAQGSVPRLTNPSNPSCPELCQLTEWSTVQ